MWTVVYIAPTQEIAQKVKRLFEDDGILVHLRRVEMDDAGRASTEIMVLEGEAEEAQEILTQHLGRLR